jgi:hypothetical protein
VLARLWMSGCAEASSNKTVGEKVQGREARNATADAEHRGCQGAG